MTRGARSSGQGSLLLLAGLPVLAGFALAGAGTAGLKGGLAGVGVGLVAIALFIAVAGGGSR